MPRSFAIDPIATSVPLDESGKGTTTLTVKNSTDRPIRAWPQIKELGSTPKEWLDLEGAGEKAFSPNEVQTFKVRIDVKGSADPGKYEFKLNMISGTKGSDEESTEGPAISFEVPKRPAPPHKVPWLLIAILAVILLGGIAAIVLLLRKPGLEMPDFHGTPLAEATNTLLGMKLAATVEFKSTGTNPPRTVFDQEPKPKEKLEPTTVIKLVAESIPISPPLHPTTTVPDLVTRHLDATAASSAASAAKVKLTLAGGQFNRNAAFIGKVVDQLPKPGEKVPVDAEVSVWMGTTNVTHRIDPRLFDQLKTQMKVNIRSFQP